MAGCFYFSFMQFKFQVGKAQAENNGILDQNEKPADTTFDPLGATSNGDNTLPSTPDHLIDKHHAAPEQKSQPRTPTPSSVPSTPKSSRMQFETPSSTLSTPSHEKSDTEADADSSVRISSVPHDELVHLFRKQEKTLGRYKTRFSEVRFFIIVDFRSFEFHSNNIQDKRRLNMIRNEMEQNTSFYPSLQKTFV